MDTLRPSPPSSNMNEVRELTPTRRGFLKLGLGVAGAALYFGWRDTDKDRTSEQQEHTEHSTAHPVAQPQHNPISNTVSSFDAYLSEHDSTANTAMLGGAAFTGALAYQAFANNKHIRLYSGNSGAAEIVSKYKDNRANTLGKLVVFAPITEEILFRGLPAIGGNGSLMPIRGILSTYAFGKLHQVGSRKVYEDGKIKDKPFIDQNKLPVTQYATGGFLWMLARRRGLLHSMLAHAVINGAAAAGLEAAARTQKKGSNYYSNRR